MSIPKEVIAHKILLIRGKKIMLDKDLALLYDVATQQLTRQVHRNIDRFPEDFMFQLTSDEFRNLKCHFGTSSWGGTRKLPYAFTEHGILMLSSVLRSKRAIQVNIAIMRVFVRFREILYTHKELAHKIAELEKRMEGKDKEIQAIFEAIRRLMFEPKKKDRKIGFHARED